MKKLLLAAAATLLLASSALASEVKYAAAEPDAVITVPDGWTAKEDDGALDISSPDDSIYLSLETVAPNEAADTIKDSAKWLDDQGVKSTSKEGKVTQGDINGMPLVTIDLDGVDKDGPVSIMLAAVTISSETSAIFTYWATKGDEDKYRDAVISTIRSIKAAE